MSRSRHRLRDQIRPRPDALDRPIHIHVRLSAEEVSRLAEDQAFIQRVRLLLHEQAGGCYSGDASRCYDNHHRPPIQTVWFVHRMFGIGPRPEDDKTYAYDWKADPS